jgi:hypothetical protein
MEDAADMLFKHISSLSYDAGSETFEIQDAFLPNRPLQTVFGDAEGQK